MLRNGFGNPIAVGVSTHAVCQIIFAETPTGAANARLIAAAPELLEAMELLNDEAEVGHAEYQDWCETCRAVKAAKAAIAKARGVTE